MADDARDDQAGAVVRLISAGADAAGAALGAIVGLTTGNPTLVVAGAVGGSVLSNAVTEVAGRVLGRRQEVRAGAVSIEALAAIRAREALGESVRADGFFHGDRSDGDEFVEGVLRAAMDAHEERKLPYLANLIANVAFTDHVDAASANKALRLADELSWMELKVLAVFALSDTEVRPLPDRQGNSKIISWQDSTIGSTYTDLVDVRKLVHHGTQPKENSRARHRDARHEPERREADKQRPADLVPRPSLRHSSGRPRSHLRVPGTSRS